MNGNDSKNLATLDVIFFFFSFSWNMLTKLIQTPSGLLVFS